jgi:UDP-glucose 4-epimerase
MTIIILGGSGFLGQSLLKRLQNENFPYKLLIHKKIVKHNSCFYGDITDKKILENNIADGDIIINLIGQENENMFDENIKASYNLLNSAIKKNNIKIIFISSILVYGESIKHESSEQDIPKPTSDYGIIKLLAENIYSTYHRLFGLNITVLRFSNIYGPKKKSGIITKCFQALKQQKSVIISHNGNQTRDFLHVEDAVEAILSVLKKQPSGFEIFNISSGTGIKVNQIINLIEKHTKKIIPKKFVIEESDIKHIVGNNLKAKKHLNFLVKIDINKGIKNMVNLL